MQLPRNRSSRARPSHRGSALLLSFLVLLVLAAIVFQLSIGTSTDARVARNDVALTNMDQAIESAMLEVFDRLKTDGESSAAGAGTTGGAPAGDASPAEPGGPAAGAGGAAGQQSQPVDSHEDSWGKPQRTTINDIELRVLIQDEDSKLNVLGMLTADEDEARKAFERVVRVLDQCREGTTVDIDTGEARRMAEEMRDYMRRRTNAPLPRPKLLSDIEKDEQLGLPLSLEEFGVLERWGDGMFRDFRDDRGRVVHSVGSFLTVWTSLSTHEDAQANATSGQSGNAGDNNGGSGTPGSGGNNNGNANANDNGGGDAQAGGDEANADGGDAQGGSGQNGQNNAGGGSGQNGSGSGGAGTQPQAPSKGGIAVNVNTAPLAVLISLMDERDVSYRFWDKVLEYRNLEEEPPEGEDKPDPVLDEFGNEVIHRQVFDSLEELSEVDGYDRIQTAIRNELGQLLDTQSHVFSIYVTARRTTDQQGGFGGYRGAPKPGEKEDLLGNALTRTVRAVVWRRQDGEQIRIVPIVRWEVLDYTPFDVQDYPDADR